MKATGIIRNVDDLGRIVIPIEFRRALGVALRDPMEISMEGNTVVLRKNETTCVFCGGTKRLDTFHGRAVCENCRNEFKKEL